jgi:chemotaxis protein methyltransferase CheR
MVNISVEEFGRIKELVYKKSGIALDKEKHFDKLSSFINKHSRDLEMGDFRKYLFFLRFHDSNGEEFQKLINAITVNETYFFRENRQFEVMVKYLLPKLDKIKPKGETIRILSAPSSTGEEPYSMVIHIMEEGSIIESRDIEIIGIDIDSTVIEKAKAASYTNRSIHAIPESISAKYFQKRGSLNYFDRDLANAVEFRVANVFNKSDMKALGKFDIIFSRNMLIYFDDKSQKEVVLNFYDILKKSGFILLGHAEYMNRIVDIYKSNKIEDVLIYQKI